MKKLINCILTMLIFLFLFYMMTGCKAKTAKIIKSGKCGENVTWTLDENKNLIISGKGKLENTEWDKKIEKVKINGKDYVDIASITIKEGVEAGEQAWLTSTAATSISLPDSFKTLPSVADNPKLKKIDFGDGLQSIGDSAFENDTSLTEIKIPDSVKEIGSNVFNNCYHLRKVILSNSIESLDSYLFCYCYNLEEITIGKNVKKIEAGNYTIDPLFLDCYNLKKVINLSHAACPLRTFHAFHFGSGMDWKVDGKSVKSVTHNTAVATPKTYRITYDTGGGTFQTEKINEYTYGKTQKLPIMQRKGYVFGGWRYDKEATSTMIITAGRLGNYKMIALWEKIKVSNISPGTMEISIRNPTKHEFSYKFEYVTKKDMSDRKTIEFSDPHSSTSGIAEFWDGRTYKNASIRERGNDTVLTIKNLKEGQKYYYRFKYKYCYHEQIKKGEGQKYFSFPYANFSFGNSSIVIK